MLKPLLIVVTILLTTTIYSQKNSIELEVLSRYDKHSDYTTRFGDRSYTNDTRLWGKSFGLNINYARFLLNHLNIKVRAGYYNLGIDKVRQTTPFNIIATERNINYRHPSGILPLFATNKYHYDNLIFSLGFAYENTLTRKLNFITAAEFNYMFTFSQLYHITYDNIRYRTNNGRMLGYEVNLLWGVTKKFNNDKNYLSPGIIIPVYQQLRGDEAFGEDGSVKMNKYFNGIGLSLAIGKCF